MSQLGEFIQHHPLLTTGVVLLAVAAIAIEIRHRLRGAAALSPAQAVQLINGGALIVDVRSAEAFAGGHIIDARNIVDSELQGQADTLKKYKEKPVILYCDNGGASAAAARLLKSLGFTKAVNLSGGLAAWKQDNLPTVTASAKNSGKAKK
ncbi:MAG TPA: rhodanese-like domain-containing protein [Steroidobacteraceae bacterium]|nr:rhodanese-like domain-containing protein [Steroidobacteraceae bacterium]